MAQGRSFRSQAELAPTRNCEIEITSWLLPADRTG